jgi:hypothetical protein
MRSLLKFGIAFLLALVASRASAGELVDRLVASVENVPILQSDWDHAIGLEALEQGRTPESLSAEERRAVLDRLVDQQLLRQQMGDENIAVAEERDVATQLEKIRADYPQVKSDEDWQLLLAKYGIDQDMLHRDVARQLQVLRFVDLRLRPESHVAREEIEAYYRDTLIPEVRRRAGKEQSLAEVYPQIEEILRQQRMDTLLNSWLQDLRGHSNIEWLGTDASRPAEGSPVATSGGR